MLASNKGHTDIVKLLLENKADIEAKNKTNSTPLIIASDKGYKDIVKIFQSDSSVNMLMTNPSQVSTLVDELKKLNVLENELLMSTASNDDNYNKNDMNYKKTE